ncbi:DUF1992 domain-containing protein [Thermodesulfovibrionales bacterium]|nr:DUF1992 domain-containing protein [Thermodesulfovibrionales bacterium]MCL0046674.1 DUF1992 domain-containing protein [Thermodesulfovibrionales bacterium]MCL0051182.1 DUF1992 domain-containing protein [Thermodesulfovibrionales bacterium]MCL0072399.1 DUF1992 domain-containing protein [Thermodesulfovibrionales bacterium]MCL0083275.1 DUF1992 domain-containing protein [Thermodesulfovibrionales bacterium]
MNIITKVAEEKIRRAIENGEFNNLKGKGKPIIFEDETWIPKELRSAYRVLKNAGCIPPELQLRKEIISLWDLISTIGDDKERLKRLRELNFKILRLNMLRKSPLSIEDFPRYEQQIFEKIIG